MSYPKALDWDEIDEQIAQEVMGWTYGEGEHEGWWINKDGYHFYDVLKWMPTCDMGCAWLVVKRFVWPKYYVRLLTTSTGNWRCDIDLNGGDGPVVSDYHEHASMAICMAALKAVRAK